MVVCDLDNRCASTAVVGGWGELTNRQTGKARGRKCRTHAQDTRIVTPTTDIDMRMTGSPTKARVADTKQNKTERAGKATSILLFMSGTILVVALP